MSQTTMPILRGHKMRRVFIAAFAMALTSTLAAAQMSQPQGGGMSGAGMGGSMSNQGMGGQQMGMNNEMRGKSMMMRKKKMSKSMMRKKRMRSM